MAIVLVGESKQGPMFESWSSMSFNVQTREQLTISARLRLRFANEHYDGMKKKLATFLTLI